MIPSLLALLLTLPGALRAAEAVDEAPRATTLKRFASIDAVQGVAVDARYIYALSARHVSRHDKRTGRSLSRHGKGDDGTRFMHLDSGVVHAGRLYAAHSDWPRVPTRSSVEVWNTATLAHVASHDFGTRRGAFTWLDRHAGAWWGTFTDYARALADGEPGRAERELIGTHLVEMNATFAILGAWTFPPALSRRFAPMSNSGGSWAADGRLWVTGHDRAEAYVLALPPSGSVLDWVATVALPDIEGQGIAWDRSTARPVLYGLNRSARQIVRMAVPAAR